MIGSKFMKRVSGVYMTMIRNRSPAAAISSKKDPVQQLFLDKLKEYAQKSQGGKLVDPDENILKELTAELHKLERNYGGGKDIDMTAFPDVKFDPPKLDPIDEEAAAKEKAEADKAKKK